MGGQLTGWHDYHQALNRIIDNEHQSSSVQQFARRNNSCHTSTRRLRSLPFETHSLVYLEAGSRFILTSSYNVAKCHLAILARSRRYPFVDPQTANNAVLDVVRESLRLQNLTSDCVHAFLGIQWSFTLQALRQIIRVHPTKSAQLLLFHGTFSFHVEFGLRCERVREISWSWAEEHVKKDRNFSVLRVLLLLLLLRLESRENP